MPKSRNMRQRIKVTTTKVELVPRRQSHSNIVVHESTPTRSQNYGKITRDVSRKYKLSSN